ncbi:unnamed protein product [Protopolystoma xenopodis]|uniref:Uncharacterized protein n=1 Tax=Protopolystoma xenopodis TaxID=117903 RepID=A0A3S5CR84_9PLAT|nr:unnamed protein product [Protopolystoma xenopodis]
MATSQSNSELPVKRLPLLAGAIPHLSGNPMLLIAAPPASECAMNLTLQSSTSTTALVSPPYSHQLSDTCETHFGQVVTASVGCNENCQRTSKTGSTITVTGAIKREGEAADALSSQKWAVSPPEAVVGVEVDTLLSGPIEPSQIKLIRVHEYLLGLQASPPLGLCDIPTQRKADSRKVAKQPRKKDVFDI